MAVVGVVAVVAAMMAVVVEALVGVVVSRRMISQQTPRFLHLMKRHDGGTDGWTEGWMDGQTLL